MNSPLRETFADFRSCWKQLLLTDVIYKVIAFTFLTPLLGTLFRILVSMSGDEVLSDTDIVFFLLKPVGWICLILAGAVWLGIVALEQASLLGILCARDEDESLSILGALSFAAKKSVPVVLLGARLVAYTLAVVAPFLLIAALVYWFLLTDFDINYYLNEKPPAFLVAIAIGAVLSFVLISILLRLFSGWFFALPIMLFEDVTPRKAIRLSTEAAIGCRRKLVAWIIGWVCVSFFLAAVASSLIGGFARLFVPDVSRSLYLIVLAIGATLVVLLIVNLLVSLFNAASFAAIHYYQYRSVRRERMGRSPRMDVSDYVSSSRLIRLTTKRLVALLAVGPLIAMVVGLFALNSIRLDDDILVMAHRGASSVAPENTMAAIRQAIADDADFVEIDVQETADGEVVVLHDSDFMKLAGNKIKIWDATSEDLSEIDIGSWFAPEFADQRVPSLAEVLDECKGKIKVNIELKYYGHDQKLEERVVALVEERQMKDEVMAMSLKRAAVTKMKTLRPDWKVGLLMSVAAGDLSKLDADFLAVNASFVDRQLVDEAHAVGKEVFVWTVNDAATMSVMVSRGVDGLLTDKPGLARTVLQQRAKLSGPARLLIELAVLVGIDPELGEQ
ncbi:MAG: glycerophosphodiester phosphodiesterase [Rubripirellula sp.]|nr:glycerophosphodiester phosphodiesterase [Rubripirellula sp.]